MTAETLSLIGCVLAIVVLLVLIMRGVHILLVGVVCVVIITVFGGLPMSETILKTYMQGVTAYITSYFMLFFTGTLLGTVMDKSGAAFSIAQYLVSKIGTKNVVVAIALACGALVFGGVSCVVVSFAVLPLAETMFEAADIPRRFLPGVIAFGDITFAMTAPGSPQLQNIVPMNLGTSAVAGWGVGIIVALVMFILGMVYLKKAIANAQARGEHYTVAEGRATVDATRKIPHGLVSLIPIVVTVVALNAFGFGVEFSILLAIVVAWILFWKFLNIKNFQNMVSSSFLTAIEAIFNTSIIVGFGTVVQKAPAFGWIIENVTKIPGPALVGVALTTAIICGVTGSASGGIGLTVPIIGPVYSAMGVPMQAIHRVAAIASGSLDSLPHNGFVVTLMKLCHTTHKEAYFPVFVCTVVIPCIGTILSIILFSLCPCGSA